MKKFGKKIICGALMGALALGALTGCSDKKVDGTQIVATVDGTEITMGTASFLARYQQASTEAMYQQLMGSYDGGTMDIWDGETENGKTYGEEAKDNIMTTLNQMLVMEKHAADYGVTVTDEEKEAITAAAEGFMSANSAEVIEKIGVSQSDIERLLELQTIQSKMYDPMTADVDTEVSDEEANQTSITLVKVSTVGTQKDEDGNTIDLTDEEKAQKKEEAQQVLDKVKAAGAEGDMDALAKEVDESLSSSKRTYTTATAREDGNIEEEILDAVEGLTDGQVYDGIVELSDGYVVVRMEKVLDEEATESHRNSVISSRQQELYNDTLEQWTEEFPIEVVDSVWKQLTITDDVSFSMTTNTETTAE